MNVHSVNRKADKPDSRDKAQAKVRRHVAKVIAARGRGRPIVDDKRRRILDAALRCFALTGYHGTRIPDVAMQAHIGTGTVYRYFKDKEALVNEVYRDAKLRLRSALLDAAPVIDLYVRETWEAWFAEIWRRL